MPRWMQLKAAVCAGIAAVGLGLTSMETKASAAEPLQVTPAVVQTTATVPVQQVAWRRYYRPGVGVYAGPRYSARRNYGYGGYYRPYRAYGYQSYGAAYPYGTSYPTYGYSYPAYGVGYS